MDDPNKDKEEELMQTIYELLLHKDEDDKNFVRAVILSLRRNHVDCEAEIRAMFDMKLREDGDERLSEELLDMPIHEAIKAGKTGVLLFLLNHCTPNEARHIVNKRLLKLGTPLELAATRNDVDSVRLLLYSGADPDTKIADRDVTVLAFVCGNYDGRDTREPAPWLDTFVQLFLSHNANVLCPSSYTFFDYMHLPDPVEKTIASVSQHFYLIHLCGEIAKRSPEAAKRVVDATPPHAIDALAEVPIGGCERGHIGSPLSIAVIHGLIEEAVHYDNLLNYPDYPEDGEILDDNLDKHFEAVTARTFQGSVFPLLSYGGQMVPDPFYARTPTYWQEFILANDLLFRKIGSKTYFENEPAFYLIDLVTAIRGKGQLKLSELLSSDATQRNDLLRRKLFLKFTSIFPLSLQKLCRFAILSALPVGKGRPQAIDKLQLPAELTNFLKFSEFNI